MPDFQKFPIKVAASQAEKNYLAKQEAMSKGRNPSGPTRRADRGKQAGRRVYMYVCVYLVVAVSLAIR